MLLRDKDKPMVSKFLIYGSVTAAGLAAVGIRSRIQVLI